MAECCGNGNRLIYACSGAADVGEIADRVARKLAKEGFAKLSCLAGVGGHVSGFIASALGEVENIVIDGCPLACAQKTLQHIDAKMTHYVLTDMGLEKGKTPATDSIVEEIANQISKKSPNKLQHGSSSFVGGCTCGSC